MIPTTTRTLIIPEHTYLLLEECAADLRKKQDNELLKELITPLSVAQRLIVVALEKRGYGK